MIMIIIIIIITIVSNSNFTKEEYMKIYGHISYIIIYVNIFIYSIFMYKKFFPGIEVF